MKNKNIKKIVSFCYSIAMKALPFCAVVMAVVNSNSTTCWVNGQPTPPKKLKKYRKF